MHNTALGYVGPGFHPASNQHVNFDRSREGIPSEPATENGFLTRKGCGEPLGYVRFKENLGGRGPNQGLGILGLSV
jgi:hypothetical protein